MEQPSLEIVLPRLMLSCMMSGFCLTQDMHACMLAPCSSRRCICHTASVCFLKPEQQTHACKLTCFSWRVLHLRYSICVFCQQNKPGMPADQLQLCGGAEDGVNLSGEPEGSSPSVSDRGPSRTNNRNNSDDDDDDDDDGDYTRGSELPFLSRTSVMLSRSNTIGSEVPIVSRRPSSNVESQSFSFRQAAPETRHTWLRGASARLLGRGGGEGGAGARAPDRTFQAGPIPLVGFPSRKRLPALLCRLAFTCRDALHHILHSLVLSAFCTLSERLSARRPVLFCGQMFLEPTVPFQSQEHAFPTDACPCMTNLCLNIRAHTLPLKLVGRGGMPLNLP